MKKFLALALTAIFFLPGFVCASEKKATPESLPGVTVVSADSVKKWLDNGDEVLVLDARKTGDFEEGHLPDSVHSPVPTDLNIDDDTIKRSVTALEGVSDLKDVGKDYKIVAYCNGAS